MKVIIFEETAYYKLLEEMKQMFKKTIVPPTEKKEWIGSEEAKELLGIKSKSKLQQLRDDNEIVFSQHGRNIVYQRKSIIGFLERNSNL